MIQIESMLQMAPPAAQHRPASSPRLWGLTAQQLHDAFWRSKGVQCVRRGRKQRLQKGAELFLLIEPDQLVLFNIAELSDRLTWHNAKITRLRLLDEDQERYSEHVLIDERGLVQRIERRYRPRVQASARALLTASRRLAGFWMASRASSSPRAGRREAWNRIRRAVSRARVDHCKCAGAWFTLGDVEQEHKLIIQLVERWPHPDQAISGLEEIEPGVWHVADETVTTGVVRVGPLWLGRGRGSEYSPCVVGPSWMEDCRASQSINTSNAPGIEAHAYLDALCLGAAPVASLKEIIDVELADATMLEEFTETGRWYQAIKRMFDIVASFVALLVLIPVMALIGLCVFIESGRPLFFGHLRQGRGGRLFVCWKFRTMRHNAEKAARELGQLNRADGPQVLIPNDPRVTKVGRFLRATNLDELPQFWNVLIGQMSLVGPRPSPDDENQFCPAWRDLRLSVRPGITGLWQLKRTREPGEDFQEWIKYDIEYVQRANFWLDLEILIRTVKLLLLKRRSFSAFE